MSKQLLLATLFALLANGNQQTFDCPMRQLALEFAVSIQPQLTMDQLQEIADALNGAKEAQNCSVTPDDIDWEKLNRQKPKRHRTPVKWNEVTYEQEKTKVQIFVDVNRGDDANDGTIDFPLQSIHTAIEKSRSYEKDTLKYIVLRGGRHYLKETITLTYEDSNMVITNFDGEWAEVSGALPIDCTWKLYKQNPNNINIYECTLTSFTSIMGLRVNGVRAIRARYPNANPETQGFGSTLQAKSWLSNPPPYLPEFEFNPEFPVRNDTIEGYFWHYNLGMGGSCANFTPPAGYWCSGNTQGGGAFTYRIPFGMTYNSTILPNSPYGNPNGGVVQAWRPGHWASWMFTVDPVKSSNGLFTFNRGGFQDARGNNVGDEFYVENLFEELDAETEWFFNTSTKILYYYNNQTGAPVTDEFEATNLKVLFALVGNMTHPVKNVTIRGLTLRDTQYTYLDNHGMPSGGDWALQRTGAIYLDGTENVTISNNLMTRLDGNAISINRYNRYTLISGNEIVWNGDSAITSWGDTDGITFPGSNNSTMGWDGTNGNQPRGLTIVQNYVHELGIWEKQSSFYFQAKSCQNHIAYNIFYNGPRAGINFNDGFGGASRIYKNLLFNTCRESGDHGPFNSWDRQVYVTDVRFGSASVIKADDEISYNFFIANYNSQEAIDNDDGSCYYYTHHNFFVYSGNGMKNDYGGHDNKHEFNIYAYIGGGFSINGQLPGHNDAYFNNTVVLTSDAKNYGTFDCTSNQTAWPVLGNNVVSTPSGNASSTGLCDLPLQEFQNKFSTDLGTVIESWPSDQQLLNQASNLLF